MQLQDKLFVICFVLIAFSVSYFGYTYYSQEALAAQEQVPVKTKKMLPGNINTVISTVPVKQQLDKEKKLFDELSVDPNSKKIELADAIGSNTRGEGYILRDPSRTFIAFKAFMPPPPEGNIYQVWLMRETPRKFYVPLGRIEKQLDGAFLYAMPLSSSYPEFNQLLVTLETAEDNKPERTVMQGILP